MNATNEQILFSEPRGAQIVELSKAPQRIIVAEPDDGFSGEVTARLQELLRLEPGWDGYRAKPINLQLAIYSQNIISAVCSKHTPRPSIVPGTNEDLQIEWHVNGVHVEVHVRGPNDAIAYYENEAENQSEELQMKADFRTLATWIADLPENGIANPRAAQEG